MYTFFTSQTEWWLFGCWRFAYISVVGRFPQKTSLSKNWDRLISYHSYFKNNIITKERKNYLILKYFENVHAQNNLPRLFLSFLEVWIMSEGKGLLCYKSHYAHVRTVVLIQLLQINTTIVILLVKNKVISGPGSVICRLHAHLNLSWHSNLWKKTVHANSCQDRALRDSGMSFWLLY